MKKKMVIALPEFSIDKKEAKRILKEIVLFIPRFIKLFYSLVRDPEIPRKAKIVSLFCVGYLINPIDLIPDFIPVIGWVDDLYIVVLGIGILIKVAGKEKLEEYWTGDTALLDLIDEINNILFFFLSEEKMEKLRKKLNLN